MSAATLSAAALAYAARGWPVLPLKPRDKIPRISKADGGRGCHDASICSDQIAEWWTRWPNANIGLATGTAFVVLDVDGEEGLATLADLEDLHGWLPIGPASVTGSGGMHLLFAGNARVRNSVQLLGPGLDTRAAGGYIVAPPSIHPDGPRYTWLKGRDPWAVQLVEAPTGCSTCSTRHGQPIDHRRSRASRPRPTSSQPWRANSKPWPWRLRRSATTP